VQNVVEPGTEETQPLVAAVPGGGQGLEGMRRRLESVGGRLDVRRRNDPPTFTATAWLPVRSR
jgi:signal transduction histidine kinase